MRGHIRKRGSKWCIVLFLGYDEQGKKRYKWIGGFGTKKAAEKALAEKIHEIDTGVYVEQEKVTVADYFRTWLNDKRTQVRPGTYRSYEWLVTKHIIPHIGKYELSKLKPMHLQRLYTTLQTMDEPISHRSILHAHRIIHQALDKAVRWGMVARNVADAVDPPRPRNHEIQTWSEEELAKFLSEAKRSRFYIAFVLAAYTGMRLGEVLALRWEDVDLENQVAHIRRTYSYTGKGYKVEEPKTDRGRRSIALSPFTVSELKKHRVRQAQDKLRAGELWKDHGLIVTTSLGTPVLQSNLRTLFYRIIERTGLPRIRIHDLRHTHATLLLKAGTHPKVVQERLGHADIQTTLNIYSHVLPGLQEAAAGKFDELVQSEKGEQETL